jgi:hypothetical protein
VFNYVSNMGGLNLMDPSAERVVYEKSANQPQPQLPSSTDRLQRKKSSWIIISLSQPNRFKRSLLYCQKLNCTRFFSPIRSLLPLTHKNLRSQSLQKVLSSTVKNNSVSSPKKEGGFGACIGKGLEKVCSFNWGSKRD